MSTRDFAPAGQTARAQSGPGTGSSLASRTSPTTTIYTDERQIENHYHFATQDDFRRHQRMEESDTRAKYSRKG